MVLIWTFLAWVIYLVGLVLIFGTLSYFVGLIAVIVLPGLVLWRVWAWSEACERFHRELKLSAALAGLDPENFNLDELASRARASAAWLRTQAEAISPGGERDRILKDADAWDDRELDARLLVRSRTQTRRRFIYR